MVNKVKSANSNALTELSALQKTMSLLEDILEAPSNMRADGDDGDVEVEINGHRFMVGLSTSAATSAVSSGIDDLMRAQQSRGIHVEPLLVVPFMSGSSKIRCKEAGVSWLDLSGNADIRSNELFILIEGRPNQYKTPGRPRNPFAPKSSRIIRTLLHDSTHHFQQIDLVEKTGVSKALVSQVVHHLEDLQLITRSTAGAINVIDPAMLVDEWRDNYSITDHQVTKGHIHSAGQGPELVAALARQLNTMGMNYAFTGLSSAWHYAPFASFRLATVFVKDPLGIVNFKELGFSTEPRGANVWVIQPNDEGVFWDSEVHQGVRFASSIQTYLDLKDHPERADEASIEMRSFLSRNW